MKTREILKFGEFRIDPWERVVYRDSKPVTLNRRSFDLLLYLAQHPGRALSKEELLKHVWGDAFVEENNLTQSISKLRKALNDAPGEGACILTLAGEGYQFTRTVEIDGPTQENALHSPALMAGSEHMLLEEERTVRTTVVTESRSYRRLTYTGAALAAIVVAGGAVAAYRYFHSSPPVTRKVVIANFRNTTGEPIFDDSLQTALRVELAQTPFLELMGDGKVRDTLLAMERPPDSKLTVDVAREVCERANYQVLLQGSILRVGGEYLLTGEASDCSGNQRIASASSRIADPGDIFAAMDSITRDLRRQLGESRKQIAQFQVPLTEATTSSLQALRDYSQSTESEALGDERTAQELDERAIALDPNFASAYAALALTYYNRGDFGHASNFYKKAFDLREHATQRERLAIEVFYYASALHDFEQSVRTLKLYLETYPDSTAYWGNLCNVYTQLGEYQLAIDAGEHALRVDPHALAPSEQLARALKRAGRFDEAKKVVGMGIANGRNSWGMHSILFQIAFAEHDATNIKTEGEWGLTHQHVNQSLDDLGLAAATGGRLHEAESDLSRSRAESIRSGNTDYADEVLLDLARAFVVEGEPEKSAAVLKQMHGDGSDPAEFAITASESGDLTPAERFVAKFDPTAEQDTIRVFRELPMVRAELALKHHKPLEAIQDLEPARPYQLPDLEVPWLRAEAEAEAGQLDAAALDYRFILANEGVDPLDPKYTLSHLELARVLAIQKNDVAAGNEYKAFLEAWKDADADLSLFRQAQRELADLQKP